MWSDDVERVTADGYLRDLQDRPLDELRSMRDECGAIEDKVSYLRRLVQGRLDILNAELRRRAEGGGAVDLDSLVEQLPDILSDNVHAPGPGRLPRGVAVPDDDDELTAELDAVAAPEVLADLSRSSDAEVEELVAALADLERRVSDARKRLFGSIDTIHAELVRRFRNGEGGPIPGDA
jgi:hypothetical protein